MSQYNPFLPIHGDDAIAMSHGICWSCHMSLLSTSQLWLMTGHLLFMHVIVVLSLLLIWQKELCWL